MITLTITAVPRNNSKQDIVKENGPIEEDIDGWHMAKFVQGLFLCLEKLTITSKLLSCALCSWVRELLNIGKNLRAVWWLESGWEDFGGLLTQFEPHPSI